MAVNAVSPLQTPPGPRRRRLGPPPEVMRDPTGYLEKQAREFGDISAVNFGRLRATLINHPDLIRTVLVNDARLFHKGEGLKRAKRLLGEGLLTSEDDFHLKQRRLLQPVFLKARLQNYATAMGQHAFRMAQRWENGTVVNMGDEMSRLTMAVVGETLFSADIEDESPEIRAALDESMRLFNSLSSPFAAILDMLPFGPSKEFKAARSRLDATIYRLIAQRRESKVETGDLLSLLLDARYDDGSAMDDEQVRDEAMTIFLAGHETTANALAWTWYLLAQNPDVAERLALETKKVLNGRAATLEDLDALVYTRQVVSESMRLYPPAWIIGRRSLTDYTIEHDGNRYLVPQNSLVIMSQWVMHRDARFWDEPHRFDPERWRIDLLTTRPKFAYFPFSAGPRQCIGEGFAWMEAILLLATTTQNWKARVVESATVNARPSITLRPLGLTMRLEKRV